MERPMPAGRRPAPPRPSIERGRGDGDPHLVEKERTSELSARRQRLPRLGRIGGDQQRGDPISLRYPPRRIDARSFLDAVTDDDEVRPAAAGGKHGFVLGPCVREGGEAIVAEPLFEISADHHVLVDDERVLHRLPFLSDPRQRQTRCPSPGTRTPGSRPEYFEAPAGALRTSP